MVGVIHQFLPQLWLCGMVLNDERTVAMQDGEGEAVKYTGGCRSAALPSLLNPRQNPNGSQTFTEGADDNIHVVFNPTASTSPRPVAPNTPNECASRQSNNHRDDV